MTPNMKAHLPQVDLDKMAAILDIETRFVEGRISLEDGRKEIAQRVGSIRPYHLAFIEQTMTEHTDDECIRENMAQKIKLFEGFMDTSRPDLPADHPIAHYYAENDAFRRLLLAVEDLVQYPVIKNQWLELFDQLRQYPTHYARKQNQLYPVLERKGFDRPTTTMWTFDDMVRDLIRDGRQLLDAGDEEAFVAKCQDLIYYGRDLMEKEETILYPTSLAMISPAEFEDMKEGDREIGFAFITVDAPTVSHASASPAAAPAGEGFAADLQGLLAKYGYAAPAQDALLDVTTGRLTLEQINLIYQHLPIDISFVDENELVRFYSDTDHRIFPRSKNVIGREVMNCHPRKSAHVVREVIDKLRSGEQDKAEFWINKPEVFLYIIYVAVRDKAGRFRGVLEMMQDCTRIRAFEGSRTLLKWADDEGIPTEAPATEAASSTSDVENSTSKIKNSTSEVKKTTSEVENTPTNAADDRSADAADDPEALTPTTKLSALFERYPELRHRMTEISPLFAMLKTPFGKLMAKKADLQAVSDRSGVAFDRLVAGLQRIIADLRKE